MSQVTSKSDTPQNTRDKILDSAEDLFASKGFSGATLDDIAAIVGIRRPSLLYHFASKVEIYHEVMNRLIGPQRDRLAAIYEQDFDSTFDKLSAMMLSWVGYVSAHTNYAKMLLHSTAQGYDPEVRFWEESNEARKYWQMTLEDGIAQGEFKKHIGKAQIFALTGGYTSSFLILCEKDTQGEIAPQTIEQLKADLIVQARALLLK
ncbi:MAG: TetR/AcrR family transcriptional regulator [Pseudomonadales bacterium]